MFQLQLSVVIIIIIMQRLTRHVSVIKMTNRMSFVTNEAYLITADRFRLLAGKHC